MPRKPSLQDLLDRRDLKNLVNLLRTSSDAPLRAEVAASLPMLDDTNAAEPLARTALEDPDPAVQQAARLALQELVGNNATLVMQSYKNASQTEGPWILPEEELPAEPEDDTQHWDRTDLHGLMSVLHNERNEDMRLKAVHAISQISGMEAVDVLAHLTLWDEAPRVRRAAKTALEEIYGPDLPALLDQYRAAGPDEIEEDEEEDIEGDDVVDAPVPARASMYNQPQGSPTIQPDRPGGVNIVIIVITLVVITAMVLLYFMR